MNVEMRKVGPDSLCLDVEDSALSVSARAVVTLPLFLVLASIMWSAPLPGMTAILLAPAALLLLFLVQVERHTWTFDPGQGTVTEERWYPWRGNEVLFEHRLSSIQKVDFMTVPLTTRYEYGSHSEDVKSNCFVARLVFDSGSRAVASFLTVEACEEVVSAIRAHLSRPAWSEPRGGTEASLEQRLGKRAASCAALRVVREAENQLELRTGKASPGRLVVERWLTLLPAGWLLLATKWLWAPHASSAASFLTLVPLGALLSFAALYGLPLLEERSTCVMDRNREKLRIERRRLFFGARVEEHPLPYLRDVSLRRSGNHYDLSLVLYSGEELLLLRAANLETALRGGALKALRRFLARSKARKTHRGGAGGPLREADRPGEA